MIKKNLFNKLFSELQSKIFQKFSGGSFKNQRKISMLKQLQNSVKKTQYSFPSVCAYIQQLMKWQKFNLAQKHTYLLLTTQQTNRDKYYLASKIESIYKRVLFKSHKKMDDQQLSDLVGKRIIKNQHFVLIIILFIASIYLWKQSQKNSNESGSKNSKKDSNKSSNILGIITEQDTSAQKNITTRFSDVIGIDQYKEQLTQLVDYLKDPEKYKSVGAKLPKGILLTGAPGTGKTLLARALAGQAGCSFFYKSGSQFDQIFVGVGAKRVRQLFQKARQQAPSIIFIDEIDTVAGKRSPSATAWSRQTINQILAQMDGFKQTDNIIVIGATNLQKQIDPAIKRPGRFDKIIHVPLPDAKGRQDMFKFYLQKIKFSSDVNSNLLARRTIGFTGADIQNMVNLSILNAVKNNRQQANLSDFQYANDRLRMGIGRKKMMITLKEKTKTSYHQIGHAVINLLTKGTIPLHKVTILPTGGALGYASMVPQKDYINITKRGILAHIDVCMGGRAAEQVFFGNQQITSGCSSDLLQATKSAYDYVKKYGMQDNLRLISPGSNYKTSEKFNEQVDREVSKILKQSYDRVKKTLKEHEKAIKLAAETLIEKQTMTAEEVKTILKC